MMQTAACSYCGKTGFDFGTVSAEVQLRYHEPPCPECKETHTRRVWLIFCSPECLVRYAMEKGFTKEVARLAESRG
jgi:phage FluMu protein Com